MTTPSIVILHCLNYYKASIEDFSSKKRYHNIINTKKAATYILFKYYNISQTCIGGMIKCSPCNVCYYYRKSLEHMKYDPVFREDICKIKNTLRLN